MSLPRLSTSYTLRTSWGQPNMFVLLYATFMGKFHTKEVSVPGALLDSCVTPSSRPSRTCQSSPCVIKNLQYPLLLPCTYACASATKVSSRGKRANRKKNVFIQNVCQLCKAQERKVGLRPSSCFNLRTSASSIWPFTTSENAVGSSSLSVMMT